MNQQPLSQPVESPIDPSPYSNQPKPTPKLPLLIILPVLIATIVGVIGYTIAKQMTTPKPPSAPPTVSTPVPNDPTANWKTYTNTLAGYILKYPDEWTPMTKSAGLGLDNAKDDAQEVSISLLSIKVFDYPLPKYEYLNWNGEKFSTSKGVGLFSDEALELFPADYWRFYLGDKSMFTYGVIPAQYILISGR